MLDPSNHPPQEALHAYLDHELSPSEMEELEQHLEGCEACQSEIAELRGLFALLESVADQALERDLRPAVVGRIQGAKRRLWQGLAAQAAVLVALLAILWPFLRAWLELPLRWIPQFDLFAFWANLQAAWLNVSSLDLRALPELLAGDVRPPGFALPLQAQSIPIWIWMAAATLAWVLGNRLLLGEARSRDEQRTS